MADIISLAIKIGTASLNSGRKDVADFGKSLQDLEKSSESTAYKVAAGFTKMGMTIATSAASSVAALGALTAALLNQFDDLNNMAEAYGYNVTQMSAMQRAAKTAGGSLSDFTGATQRVSRELAKGGEAFKNLGVSINSPNGGLKTAAELATEVAKKYTDGTITTAQYGDAQKVLGKDLDKTAKVIADVGDAQELANKLTEKGIGIYQQAAEAGAKFGDVTDESALILQSIGSIIASRFGPAMNSVIKSFNDSYTSGGLVKQAVDAIIDSFVNLAPIAVDVGAVLAKMVAGIVAGFRIAGKAIGGVVAAVVALLSGDFSGAGTILSAIKDDAGAVIDDTVKAFAGIDSFAKSTKKALEDAAKTSLTIAAPGQGKATKGPAGVDKKAAKEHNKVENEQQKLYEQLIGLRQKETNEVAKQTMGDNERLRLGLETQAQEKARLELEQKSSAILDKVLPQYKARAQIIIDEALAQQKKAALLENERILTERITKERQAQQKILDETNKKADEYISNEKKIFANRNLAPSVAQGNQRVENVGKTYDDAVFKERERLATTETFTAKEREVIEANINRLIAERAVKVAEIKALNTTIGRDPATIANDLTSAGVDVSGSQVETDARVQAYEAAEARINEMREAGKISEESASAFRMQLWAKEQTARIAPYEDGLNRIADLAQAVGGKQSKAAKAAAIAQTIITTYKNAVLAYSAGLQAGGPYGPVLGAAYAAMAVAMGLAQVRQIQSQPTGYKLGGYTGNVGKSAPAGIVHGREFVINAQATKKNRSLLEMINKGYATGGYVAPLSGGSSGARTPRANATVGGISTGDITINVKGGNTNEETGGAMRKELLQTIKQIADSRIADGLRQGGIIRSAI